MRVGVRSLKARLSEYLDRASRGETIWVTDRGRLKAVLGPVPGQLRLEQGVAEKWIRPGDIRPPARARRFPARAAIADVLAVDRDQ